MIEAGLSKQDLKKGAWNNGVNVADINLCLISHIHQ
jgi:hypothetical protein